MWQPYHLPETEDETTATVVPEPAPPRKPRRLFEGARTLSRIVLPLLLNLVVIGAFFYFYDTLPTHRTEATQREIHAAVEELKAQEAIPDSVRVYNAIRPSLVQIKARFTEGISAGELSYGTGVIINKKGQILTSLHIVKDAGEIAVIFADGTRSHAVRSEVDAAHDLATLHVEQLPAQIVPAVIGKSNSIHVGDQAIVVGNPIGLTDSLTTGVISALDRQYEPPDGSPTMSGLIQFDAAINPGNSGGPLLNRAGEVIGIVAARAFTIGEIPVNGIGFAVPIETAKPLTGTWPF